MTNNFDISKVVDVGFTGSREGMSSTQARILQHWLTEIRTQRVSDHMQYFHHGMCIGADSEAHDIAAGLGFKIILHPPLDDKYTNPILNMENVVRIDDTYSYSGRNQRIALASDIVFGTPKRPVGQGGTWNCLEHAWNAKKPRIIIHQGGSITKDDSIF